MCKVKPSKSDGNIGFSSDYFIHSGSALFVHISLILWSSGAWTCAREYADQHYYPIPDLCCFRSVIHIHSFINWKVFNIINIYVDHRTEHHHRPHNNTMTILVMTMIRNKQGEIG